MARHRTMLFVFFGVAFYWSCAIWLLFHAFVVTDDGYGREISFYWGIHAPSSYPEIAYAYLVAASILTLLGCGTIWLLRRVRTGPLQTLLLACAATFFVFCLAVGVSDAGTTYHIWTGPTALRTDRTPASYPKYMYVIVRISLLSGLLALMLKKAPLPFLPKGDDRSKGTA
jgi:hypothetical protein